MKLPNSRFLQHFRKKTIPKPLLPGVYHFTREEKSGKSRIHLRVNPDGSGFILINASRIYYLNPTALFMTQLFLDRKSPSEAGHALTHIYHVPKRKAIRDFSELSEELDILTSPDFEKNQIQEESDHFEQSISLSNHPNYKGLQTEIVLPFTGRLTAPYRMDLALTYRCNNDCAHCYNSRPRSYKEISTEAWKLILDRLWELGIPHIIFTGGEPTLREDLVELIDYAEKKGQITGINTNGRMLKDISFVNSLCNAGLDHVQITIESHDAKIHDSMVRAQGAWQDTVTGIKNVLQSSMYLMTNTTLLETNANNLEKTIRFLIDLGLKTIGLNALIYSGKGNTVNNGLPEKDLPALLSIAKKITEQNGVKLIWYTPTQYCHFDPVIFDEKSHTGLNVKGCTAALYNMCIEPDGSVIPCQSYYQSLGNILHDPWEKIWLHDLSKSLRDRKNVSLVCETCALLPVCGGGCPLAFKAGKMAAPEPISFWNA